MGALRRNSISPRKNLYLGQKMAAALQMLSAVTGVNEASIVRAALKLLVALMQDAEYPAELILQLDQCTDVRFDNRSKLGVVVVEPPPESFCELAQVMYGCMVKCHARCKAE